MMIISFYNIRWKLPAEIFFAEDIKWLFLMDFLSNYLCCPLGRTLADNIKGLDNGKVCCAPTSRPKHPNFMMKRHWAPISHEHEKPFCGRPRKPRPLTRRTHRTNDGPRRATEADPASSASDCAMSCGLLLQIKLSGSIRDNVSICIFLYHHAFLMKPDDESYPGFRCRHNISIPFMLS
ncbi:hypothetical protein BGZ61DRAFT_180220 [Ilyonectria robusta]|uniref:uncharacterized protein n=1 Tax=Ilyonectria robusta TaxID=1079257 RepID=UPI001E8EB198|nr:uncharacterized protein BGZ61DRAFT_180220 [Ilyonectria robusta]KAH8729368.1 hypothetical protein BGZ61DRAFT_180220 [Ilyonectria robusta]